MRVNKLKKPLEPEPSKRRGNSQLPFDDTHSQLTANKVKFRRSFMRIWGGVGVTCTRGSSEQYSEELFLN